MKTEFGDGRAFEILRSQAIAGVLILSNVEPGRSITKRSGFSRTNNVCSKGSLTSNTNRVFSGEAWSLMLLMVGLANAADDKSHSHHKPENPRRPQDPNASSANLLSCRQPCERTLAFV